MMRYLLVTMLLFFPLEALGQSAVTSPVDPLDLARLKSYGAYRTSSNNLSVDEQRRLEASDSG